MAHTHKEQIKNVSKELFERTLDVADVEPALSSNGNGHLNSANVRHLDVARLERIRVDLREAIDHAQSVISSRTATRWRWKVEDLSKLIAVRGERIHPSTLRSREREWFKRRRYLGANCEDPGVVEDFLATVTKPVRKKHRKRAIA
jgi:hypothetical protein